MFPLIHITSQFALPTYMIVLSLAYSVAIIFAYRRAGSDIEKKNITLDIAIIVMVSGFLGARFAHVFYELSDFYITNPKEILKFWNGGFVYYGGFITSLISALVYLKLKRLPIRHWLNFFAPVLSLGYAFGRLACHFNGCCYGDFCDWPWAIEFKNLNLPDGLRHPTALYAVLFEYAVFWFLLYLEKIKKAENLFLIWLTLHAAGRILMESFRADPRGQFIFGLSVSTLISFIILLVVLTFSVFRFSKLRGSKINNT